MGILKNKLALIVGVANTRSIAYGIAKVMHKEGAKLAFTYQNDRLKERVFKIAEEFDSDIVLPCDVSSDESISNMFNALKKSWSKLNALIHSVAFTTTDQLQSDYIDCINREGFKIAHDISSYSLSALAKEATSMMEKDSSGIVTISYLGSQRVVQNYNVMGIAKASLEASVRYLASSLGPKGIRVNAISAGAIKTLSASAVKNLKNLLNNNDKTTPLRRNITIEEVGNAAAFLCSDMASGITGDILYVDYNIMGAFL